MDCCLHLERMIEVQVMESLAFYVPTKISPKHVPKSLPNSSLRSSSKLLETLPELFGTGRISFETLTWLSHDDCFTDVTIGIDEIMVFQYIGGSLQAKWIGSACTFHKDSAI